MAVMFDSEQEINKKAAEHVSDSFNDIAINIYKGIDLVLKAKSSEMDIQAFTMKDGQEQCMLHRTPLMRIQFSYKREYGTYGIMPYYCKECNRLFLEESRVETYIKKLTEYGVKHKVYPLDISEAYFRSQIKPKVINAKETLYIPDVWIEEKPTCPIHKKVLEERFFYMEYRERKIEFKAFYCEQCHKVMIRRTMALELEDQCGDIGIPFCNVNTLTSMKPMKSTVPKKTLKPHYYIEDGKKYDYVYNANADCYQLSEEDIIVISDSIYCNLENHDTEEVMALIWVNQKREGRKLFLCLLGYCSSCQKYYMVEEDYKVVYSLGRPEVTVLSGVDDGNYQITSGEVFDMEKRHLENLEGKFTSYIQQIRSQSDYVNPYAVGSYDDGDLSYAKEVSRQRYSKILDKLRGFIPKPYSYRVDLTFADSTEVYYLGVDDIELEDGISVISFNKPFGKKLVNYRTIDVIKDGKKYDVKLSRHFDIDNAQLFGYANIRTDEDMIFRGGITDPFLIRVLNMRKRQHNLVDIMSTIQENQNRIVDTRLTQNIIVQGCAGSGKTIVLLHRLSSLKSNYPEFDLESALILTPNEQFSLHIKGLAESLQIGAIERASVEEYYVELLCKYSNEFRPRNKLVSEVLVKQPYVDYIYSDEFLSEFNKAYTIIMEKQKNIIPMLKGVAQQFGEEWLLNSSINDSEFIPLIKQKVNHFFARFNARVRETQKVEIDLDAARRKWNDLYARHEKAQQLSENAVKEAIPRVYTKLGTMLSTMQHKVEKYKITINGITEESEVIKSSLNPFGKKKRLEELEKKLNKSIKKELKLEAEIKELSDIFDNTMLEKSDQEAIEWMQEMQLYEPSIANEIRYCKKVKNDFIELCNNELEIKSEIQALEMLLIQTKANEYGDDIKRVINYLLQKTEEYSLLGTYQKVFDLAVYQFQNENQIKNVQGTHRYDLYAQLWFAMKYFQDVKGTAKFICADEGQDMSFNEYRLIYEQNNHDVIYNIYGDVNQLLKPGRGISSWDNIINSFSAKKYILNENYRNTNQITRFCNASFDMQVIQTGVDGPKVTEILRKELENELIKLSFNNKVAILIPRCVLKKNYLEKEIIPQQIQDIIGDKIENGYISLMYVDEVKGIEFDKVFVVTSKMSKNEKYIAYTRALSELVIVVDENIVDDIPEI